MPTAAIATKMTGDMAAPSPFKLSQRSGAGREAFDRKHGASPMPGSPVPTRSREVQTMSSGRPSAAAAGASPSVRGVGSPLTEVSTGSINSPSPLKRSDALFNLDATSQGSPLNLRSRRLHNLRKQPSVDNVLPPRHRESPFGTPNPIPNPSIHPLHQKPATRAPHPLSKVIVPGSPAPASSRESSGVFGARSRSEAAFANPVRMRRSTVSMGDHLAIETHYEFNTPSALQQVKPLQAAFMSTGLLSKRNRPLEHLKALKPTPNTPCKRPSFGTPAPPTPGTPLGSKEFFASERRSQPAVHTPTAGLGGGDDSALEDYLFLDGEGDSSFVYASSASDLETLPQTPTKGFFLGHASVTSTPGAGTLSLGGLAKHEKSRPRRPMLFGRSPADDDSYFLNSIDEMPLRAARLSISQDAPRPSPMTEDILGSSEDATMTIPPALESDEPQSPALSGLGPTIQRSENNEFLQRSLEKRFINVERLGSGEFNEVFSVEESTGAAAGSGMRYAVKASKTASATARGRLRRDEEASILAAIGKHEHIVELVGSWEDAGHLFIQMEYCENGSLDVFLQEYGQQSRLDEFRVWKVLTELALGVSYIHESGFLHLDLKPANIFIDFEGVLKIGDFGMSVAYPAPAHTEREGDREYIAPEVLSSGKYDKPVDVFSLGLITLEVAANIVLPDNGLSWQKLRSGDLSDAPRLSSSDDAAVGGGGAVAKQDLLTGGRSSNSGFGSAIHQNGPLAPHRYLGQGGLDRVVKWMLSPDPAERPTALDLLNLEEIVWCNRVRQAGAVIFEGDRGPIELDNPEAAFPGYSTTNLQGDADRIQEDEDWQMEM